MEKSTFTPLYEHFRRALVSMREAAGMTQRDLAKRLGRERSFVSRIELGERRLDVVEFFWVCHACGQDPAKVASDLMRSFVRLEAGEESGAARKRPRSKARGRS
jgi:transcriptional regulator with XRE-family HTH domain